EFSSLFNLKVVLGNEGFNEIGIRYLGGLWVMLVFRSVDGKEKFKGKTFWVRAKEVPGWSPEFEEQLDEDSELEDDIFGGVDKPNTDNSEEEFEDENVVPDTVFDDGIVKPSVVKNSSGNQEKEVGCNIDKQELNCDILNGGASNQGDHVNAGDVIIMGDFNEVRYSNERFGSNFNVKGANAFNSFIIQAGLKDIPLGGCSFTWCHKSGSKMSKLDRFLVSESLLSVCPTLSSITLDRLLSDHRPILLRESTMRQSFKNSKIMLKSKIANVELVIDKGNASEEVIYKRLEIVNSINELEKQQAMEMAQKAKIKWAIEGDDNSKYYHGILNKKGTI
nr:RNA-directed DNA polymerase, eukaryota [Tanacetum cinerariifolium]